MKDLNGIYCPDLFSYKRYLTREVFIGDVPMGAHHPIRIQSMTTTDTMDTMATVAQTIRMVEAGCEYVRITAPSIKEANNLAVIKKELLARGCRVPLVADIHFTPNAAEAAARIVEKVRVNPGNYVDKKKFEQITYTQFEYEEEVERIRKRFLPLINICKEYGTALRIGTNHGSLSDRIMSWHGDTPMGMVESAMEFIRMCEAENFHNLVVSMKSSNTQVMVQAYRLLVATMTKENMNYPLHLGVTEAGDGEDGRIKSAVGIGTLLEDGLGDTIRVSLTEEPELEAPVAKALAHRYESRAIESKPTANPVTIPTKYNPYIHQRRITNAVTNVGAHHVPIVMADFSAEPLIAELQLASVGYIYSAILDKYSLTDLAVDWIYLGSHVPQFNLPGNLRKVVDVSALDKFQHIENTIPMLPVNVYLEGVNLETPIHLISGTGAEFQPEIFEKIKNDSKAIICLKANENDTYADLRAFFFELENKNIHCPVIVHRSYEEKDLTKLQLHAATDFGALFIDGYADGLAITSTQKINSRAINSIAFGLLQASRMRISKTEYISCPSCGRTLFDLQETTQLIRSKTDHLKGIKIGIMGCIVNGPGEMADADYGYVGAGPGKITLYRGMDVVRKNVNTADAVDGLIEIIKEDNLWVEKP